MQYNIWEILKTADKWGFTIPLKGDLKRYVVALTHNKSANIRDLKWQAKWFNSLDNINIGGWVDTKTNIEYIDISTSLDSLTGALALGRLFNQIAIFDLKTFEEIRIK